MTNLAIDLTGIPAPDIRAQGASAAGSQTGNATRPAVLGNGLRRDWSKCQQHLDRLRHIHSTFEPLGLRWPNGFWTGFEDVVNVGVQAALHGLPHTSCPFDTADPVERVSAMAWMYGFTRVM